MLPTGQGGWIQTFVENVNKEEEAANYDSFIFWKVFTNFACDLRKINAVHLMCVLLCAKPGPPAQGPARTPQLRRTFDPFYFLQFANGVMEYLFSVCVAHFLSYILRIHA